MNVRRVNLVYFSPTGRTKQVMRVLGDACVQALANAETAAKQDFFDLTVHSESDRLLSFGETDLVLVGIPVYSGRVPATAVERFLNLKGSDTPVILLATYGHREYEDALLELKHTLEKQGFCAIGAAAIVTQHSIVQEIGVGRPNEEELCQLREFGSVCVKALSYAEPELWKQRKLTVKGNEPYRAYQTIPLKPHGTAVCNACQNCVHSCPVGAISSVRPKLVDKARCIGCMRCIQVCPRGARKLPPLMLMGAKKMLIPKCEGERKMEFFLPEGI